MHSWHSGGCELFGAREPSREHEPCDTRWQAAVYIFGTGIARQSWPEQFPATAEVLCRSVTSVGRQVSPLCEA
eukprot:12528722-Ditylum_brightwellii.AAC.1